MCDFFESPVCFGFPASTTLSQPACSRQAPWPLPLLLGTGFLALHLEGTVIHDACHKSAHPVPWINQAMGHGSALLLGFSFPVFTRVHLEHHAHVNDPYNDPDHIVSTFGPLWLIAPRFFYHEWFFFQRRLWKRWELMQWGFERSVFVVIVLAAAKFATGEVVAVGDLYRSHFDLDRKLATVTGNALITRGEFTNAVEPLRQSLKIPGPNPKARLALGVVYAEQGDWPAAEKLLMRANAGRDDVQSLLVWSDALAEVKGHDARVEAIRAIVRSYPDAQAPRVALAYAIAGSEDSPMKKRLERASRVFFNKSVKLAKPSNERQANYARWLNQWNPGSDDALAAAEKALAMSGGSPNAFIAMAEVLAARGDADKAAEWTQRAAQVGADHIGYARLIAQ